MELAYSGLVSGKEGEGYWEGLFGDRSAVRGTRERVECGRRSFWAFDQASMLTPDCLVVGLKSRGFQSCVGREVNTCFEDMLTSHLHSDWRGHIQPIHQSKAR